MNFTDSGGCDKRTGECLRCLHNTAGFLCDVCKRGYYGNAKNQTCRRKYNRFCCQHEAHAFRANEVQMMSLLSACSCNDIGTESASGPCDPTTGQCPCKPNVVGVSCDRCAPGHWDLASGKGCQPCGCCNDGSTVSQCDQVFPL